MIILLVLWISAFGPHPGITRKANPAGGAGGGGVKEGAKAGLSWGQELAFPAFHLASANPSQRFWLAQTPACQLGSPTVKGPK